MFIGLYGAPGLLFLFCSTDSHGYLFAVSKTEPYLIDVNCSIRITELEKNAIKTNTIQITNSPIKLDYKLDKNKAL